MHLLIVAGSTSISIPSIPGHRQLAFRFGKADRLCVRDLKTSRRTCPVPSNVCLQLSVKAPEVFAELNVGDLTSGVDPLPVLLPFAFSFKILLPPRSIILTLNYPCAGTRAHGPNQIVPYIYEISYHLTLLSMRNVVNGARLGGIQ